MLNVALNFLSYMLTQEQNAFIKKTRKKEERSYSRQFIYMKNFYIKKIKKRDDLSKIFSHQRHRFFCGTCLRTQFWEQYSVRCYGLHLVNFTFLPEKCDSFPSPSSIFTVKRGTISLPLHFTIRL